MAIRYNKSKSRCGRFKERFVPSAPSFLLSTQNGVTVHASRYYIGSHQTQAGGRPPPGTPPYGVAHREQFLKKLNGPQKGSYIQWGTKSWGPTPPRLCRKMCSRQQGPSDTRTDNAVARMTANPIRTY